MLDGVAHLIPADASACGAQGCWSSPRVEEETFLVTLLCCYNAKGTQNRGCEAKIHCCAIFLKCMLEVVQLIAVLKSYSMVVRRSVS